MLVAITIGSTISKLRLIITCRQAAQAELPWNSLPQHLMEPIVIQVEAIGGQRALASMRLASRSWHAAVRASPVTLKDIKINYPEDLLQLHRVAPNLATLELGYASREFDLGTLCSFTQLTALSLNGQLYTGHGSPLADISALPGRLRRLHIKGTHLPVWCFADLKIVDLTFLSFQFLENKKPEVWRLLQDLPKLRVRMLLLCLRVFETDGFYKALDIDK